MWPFFKGVPLVPIRPELVSKELVILLEKGDIDGVLGLYEPNAVFADFDGAARGIGRDPGSSSAVP